MIPFFSLVVMGLIALLFWRFQKTGEFLPILGATKQGSMYFEANKAALVNVPYTVKVWVDTRDQLVNAAGFYMRFDPEKIEVTELSTVDSFCQYYPEKRFDNQMGLVSLACGSPHPGFKGERILLEIVMLPKQIGMTRLFMDPQSQLLLSDGKGTNIIEEYQQLEVQIGTGI
jgi:hypothetical protein